MHCHVPILVLVYLIHLAPHAFARGPYFAPSSTDTETSGFLTPKSLTTVHHGDILNISWYSDQSETRLFLFNRGFVTVQSIENVQDNRWFEWKVVSGFGYDTNEPYTIQATKPARNWQSEGTSSSGDVESATSLTTTNSAVDTSFSDFPAEDDYTGGEVDNEGSKTRRVAGLVAGVTLGCIAVMICLGMGFWMIRRKQQGVEKAPSATNVDEVVETETCAEMPAQRSLPDMSNLDELMGRRS